MVLLWTPTDVTALLSHLLSHLGERLLPCQPDSIGVRRAQPGGWRSETVPTRRESPLAWWGFG